MTNLLTAPVAAGRVGPALRSLTHAATIDAVFKQGKRLSSEHFALHWRVDAGDSNTPKDDCLQSAQAVARSNAGGICVAFVVSKRLAKRAVRRNLIRRAWRALLVPLPQFAALQTSSNDVATQRSLHLVVRLAKPFSAAQYQSAASSVLKQQVTAEAQDLLNRLSLRADLRLQPAVNPASSAPPAQETTPPQPAGHLKAS